MPRLTLLLLLLGLIVLEIIGVYFIMPFPGSQQSDSLPFAYWIHTYGMWIRIALIVLILVLVVSNFKRLHTAWRVVFILLAVFWSVVFYYANFRFRADKMFVQPGKKEFADAANSSVPPERLVVGVSINGETKAYPIQIIGYHHQVRDTVGNTPVMVTYCTVCRTGRVFSPFVNGTNEDFRLVGMDHFNAMFEDHTTGSWWQQATGIAVAGKLKGQSLVEIPSQQSTLSSWLQRYPSTLILQPDTNFNKRYDGLKDFDNGTTTDALEKRDSASWQFKSWVVGVQLADKSRAYDWNMLVEKRIISDSLGSTPLIVTLENDTATFHVLSRNTSRGVLSFANDTGGMRDEQTGSLWTYAGKCEEGELKGEQLKGIQSSQEFWHSWRTFHPQTDSFK